MDAVNTNLDYIIQEQYSSEDIRFKDILHATEFAVPLSSFWIMLRENIRENQQYSIGKKIALYTGCVALEAIKYKVLYEPLIDRFF